jgi:hypothetical protein
MESAQTIERLYFLPHQVDALRGGEVALGVVDDEEKGHVCMCDIPFDWIVGYYREKSGKQLQYLKVQKKPLITNAPNQRPRWVVTKEGLLCLDNSARIKIELNHVEYWIGECGTLLFIGKTTESKSARADCEKYIEMIACFVGAMPQREEAEAGVEEI